MNRVRAGKPIEKWRIPRGQSHSLERLIQVVVGEISAAFGVPGQRLLSRGRGQTDSWARQIAYTLVLEQGLFSGPDVARAFGRNHSTIYYGRRAVRDTAEVYPEMAAAVDRLRDNIKKILDLE